jgi:arabinan endo-1,5-alpha-L-arabinosidase
MAKAILVHCPRAGDGTHGNRTTIEPLPRRAIYPTMPLVYQNPVWANYLADPFILPWGGHYFAYGTGSSAGRATADGSVFPLLRSTDLVHWEDRGGVRLEPRFAAATAAFWAPELAERDGTFYLYYSCSPTGRDEDHRIRVATSRNPEGPFVDGGPVLAETEGFTIDAHPFRDPHSGQWYLYFAKDFFDERVGTGLAVVPLAADLLRADGPSRPVLRAASDWQIYQRHRQIYGRTWTAWHTVEGPAVTCHGGRYWCFYSGGNWQTRDYSVSYGVADHPLGPWHHATGPAARVLQERPGKVLGPGHTSLVIAPDGQTQLLVYHAWDSAGVARRMCFDPLIWTAFGPKCLGPSTGRQVVPRLEP